MKIGRYEILDAIGQGAMGTVYRALDPLIEREVAIKAVPLAQLRGEGPDAEARFLREAQSAGRLSHPNIVTIYDVGETDTLAYIAMEYLPGSTLRDLMDRSPLPPALAMETALQMAEALAFAHEHGVVHRDIKPANVVVTGQRGRIKLTDFGIARLVNSNQTQAGQMLGSPRYMSPEQAMGREVDGRSDIFSLGAVLYEMLTGRYAFDGDTLPTIVYRVIHETPPAVTAQRGSLPPGLNELLARMLSKTPAARPDARDVAAALHAMMPSPHAIPPATRVATGRIPRTLRVLAFGTPIGVFLLIGTGIIVIEHFVQGQASTVEPPRIVASAPSVKQTEPATRVASSAPVPSGAPAKITPNKPRPKPVPKPDPYLQRLDDKAVELRVRRTELLLKYTEQHPDVVQIDRQLEQLQLERRKHLRQLQRHQDH
ncbi:MAG: protein kinase [Thiobacillus sp.]|nr:protein kinase [Thiobacillus sp.]